MIPSEEQVMIRDMARAFAAEQIALEKPMAMVTMRRIAEKRNND